MEATVKIVPFATKRDRIWSFVLFWISMPSEVSLAFKAARVVMLFAMSPDSKRADNKSSVDKDSNNESNVSLDKRLERVASVERPLSIRACKKESIERVFWLDRSRASVVSADPFNRLSWLKAFKIPAREDSFEINACLSELKEF